MTQRRRNKARDLGHSAHLEQFADRLDLPGTWEQLTLPEPDCKRLREIPNRVTHMRVLPQSIDKAPGRAESIPILFVGPNGTGKTLAAAVLANELDRDVYRVDLSRVMSKYIGETEKNLNRIFDAAEARGPILFFDEADALFGKRSDVKDSHDRFANNDVSYLLERMESYHGLVLLATNTWRPVDGSFASRFDCIVEFRDLADQRVRRVKMGRQDDADT